MGQRKAMGEKLCLEHGQILTDDHMRNFHRVLKPLKLDSIPIYVSTEMTIPSANDMATADPLPNSYEDVEEQRSPSNIYLRML